VLLKVNFHAGHGGSSNKHQAMREQAQQFAFLLDQLGVPHVKMKDADFQT